MSNLGALPAKEAGDRKNSNISIFSYRADGVAPHVETIRDTLVYNYLLRQRIFLITGSIVRQVASTTPGRPTIRIKLDFGAGFNTIIEKHLGTGQNVVGNRIDFEIPCSIDLNTDTAMLTDQIGDGIRITTQDDSAGATPGSCDYTIYILTLSFARSRTS